MATHFRRVELTDDNRRGLLGQGSMLAVTSYPHRTSPVVRGKWILENLLGTPPPPPPPDVPALEGEAEPGGGELSMRERIAQHRANPACASCHAMMDPLGLSLENFDFVGPVADGGRSAACRSTRRARCPTARSSTARPGLRSVLLQHPDRFVQDADRKDADLRARPGARGRRHAGGAQDRARGGAARLPLVVARPRRGQRAFRFRCGGGRS